MGGGVLCVFYFKTKTLPQGKHQLMEILSYDFQSELWAKVLTLQSYVLMQFGRKLKLSPNSLIKTVIVQLIQLNKQTKKNPVEGGGFFWGREKLVHSIACHFGIPRFPRGNTWYTDFKARTEFWSHRSYLRKKMQLFLKRKQCSPFNPSSQLSCQTWVSMQQLGILFYGMGRKQEKAGRKTHGPDHLRRKLTRYLQSKSKCYIAVQSYEQRYTLDVFPSFHPWHKVS